MNIHKETGFALISAMVVLALVTGVATSMALQQKEGIELVTDLIRYDQLQQQGDGILLWSEGVLQADQLQSQSDDLQEAWNQPLSGVEIPGGEINAVIEDMQARFNLNNLAQNNNDGKLAEERLRRLLTTLDLPQQLASAIADWVDADTQTRFPNGAEDDYYLSLDFPYRTANQPMAVVSELLLIKGVDTETYKKLLPHVSALPIGAGININTAKKSVLVSLSPDMDLSAAEALQQSRLIVPYNQLSAASSSSTTSTETVENDVLNGCTSIGCQQHLANNPDYTTRSVTVTKSTFTPVDFSSSPLQTQYNIDSNGLTVSSNYFRVTGQINQYGRQLEVSYVLYRDSQTGDVSLLYKDTNGLFPD